MEHSAERMTGLLDTLCALRFALRILKICKSFLPSLLELLEADIKENLSGQTSNSELLSSGHPTKTSAWQTLEFLFEMDSIFWCNRDNKPPRRLGIK